MEIPLKMDDLGVPPVSWDYNVAMENGPGLKMYFHSK